MHLQRASDAPPARASDAACELSLQIEGEPSDAQ